MTRAALILLFLSGGGGSSTGSFTFGTRVGDGITPSAGGRSGA